jgi:ankyrin repeat protein
MCKHEEYMNKELKELKTKIQKDKPFYLLKKLICSELSNGALKNILLLTYEIGIPADLAINNVLTTQRVTKIINFLNKDYLIDKKVSKKVIDYWKYLLDVGDYEDSLQNNPDLANEFLSDGHDTTQSRIRLVGYKDIEVNNEVNEVESKLLSEIFLEGLKEGNLDKVKKAVEKGFSIDFKDRGNRDALIVWITKKGYLDILSYLINKGIDIWNRFENGQTILMYVVKTEHIEIFDYLISLGANTTDKDDNGKTVLMHAVEVGFLPIIKKIINAKVDINVGTSGYTNIDGVNYSVGKTALMYSIASKKQEVVEYLIEQGADIHSTKNGAEKDEDGNIKYIGKNITMYAVENGNLELVMFLISKGASLLNVRDEFDNNTLIYAVIKKDLKMIKYLLSKGVSINNMNKYHLNPLIYAIKINDINIVKLLVSEGAIIDGDFYKIDDIDIKKPFHYAIEEGVDDIIKYLLSKVVNINDEDQEGKTVLMYAIEKQNIKLIKHLVNLKVDIEKTNQDGNNALWYAMKENNNKIISIIENYIKKDYR